jgi:nucleoside-diphosphate-sugar epimerase
MMGWLRRGVPLPLGAINNRRSLLALDNLTDLIVTCLQHPDAGGHVFLASDGEDLSTSALLRRTAAAMDLKTRLVPVPPRMLEIGARCVGKSSVARRLCGSLQVDIGKTRGLLDWTPPVSVDEGLRSMTDHFRAQVG